MLPDDASGVPACPHALPQVVPCCHRLCHVATGCAMLPVACLLGPFLVLAWPCQWVQLAKNMLSCWYMVCPVVTCCLLLSDVCLLLSHVVTCCIVLSHVVSCCHMFSCCHMLSPVSPVVTRCHMSSPVVTCCLIITRCLLTSHKVSSAAGLAQAWLA